MSTRLLDYESAIRGGIIRAIWHYVEANNKYMNEYDETKESTQYIFSILILTSSMNGLYHNRFHMLKLDMLKISQRLHMILIWVMTKIAILVIHL